MSTIFCSDEYYTLEQVEEDHNDAYEIEEVTGGWMVFTHATDYAIWRHNDD